MWAEASGGTYSATYNDNVVLVVMLETPVGIANAFEIASVPGVNVVLIGNYESAPRPAIFASRSAALPFPDRLSRTPPAAAAVFAST